MDKNQNDIVKELRKIPGLSVQLDVNDILVGYQGKTYWYEIKENPTSAVKDSQYQISKEWTVTTASPSQHETYSKTSELSESKQIEPFSMQYGMELSEKD